jgi:CysZ protein
MMLQDALASLRQIFTPPFRAVLVKCLLMTVVLLALVWVGLDRLIIAQVRIENGWLATALTIATGLGLFVGLAFLVAPTSSLVAGIFLDELAERVESEIGPADQIGRALPAGAAIWLASKFALVSIGVNLLALMLLLLPGINLIAFFTANAYLLGREYFELAALRYRPIEEVRQLRREKALYLFLCGLPIALLVAIPIVNLLTPLFATAFMVRVHRRITPTPAMLSAERAGA